MELNYLFIQELLEYLLTQLAGQLEHVKGEPSNKKQILRAFGAIDVIIGIITIVIHQ